MLHKLDTGALELAYTVAGDGPPLLLLHGAEAGLRMFDAITPFWTPHFTVIRYDQRDCGQTENPPTVASLAELALDARTLLRALGYEGAHVYGTSFGGRVAQALTIHHPEVVDHLILASTWALPQSLEELNDAVVKDIQTLKAGLPATAERLAAYFFPAPFLEAHPEWKDIFKNAQPQSERGRRRSQTVNERPALDIRQISSPTLLLAGELDQVVPPRLTLEMATLIPNARTHMFTGVGHAGVIQAPEIIAQRVTRFLT
jgi:pimeloyl-ACP methyl ester carboxylesterase